MRTNSSTRCGLWAVFCALAALAAHGQQLPRTRYTISLAQAQAHLAHVSIELKAGAADRRMQLPVWNALYQVRDFSQYINWVKASTPDGKPLPVVATRQEYLANFGRIGRRKDRIRNFLGCLRSLRRAA